MIKVHFGTFSIISIILMQNSANNLQTCKVVTNIYVFSFIRPVTGQFLSTPMLVIKFLAENRFIAWELLKRQFGKPCRLEVVIICFTAARKGQSVYLAWSNTALINKHHQHFTCSYDFNPDL